MLELFKKILKDNATVRQTENMARQVKSEVQAKEPRTKLDQIYVPELDEMAKQIATSNNFDKVAIFQSRTKARMIIEMKGEPSETSEKLKKIHELLASESDSTDDEGINQSSQVQTN